MNGTAPISIRVAISPEYEWHGANALNVQVYFGTAKPLKSTRINKSREGSPCTFDFDTWMVWSPDLHVWNKARFEFREMKRIEGRSCWNLATWENFELITVGIKRIDVRRDEARYPWPQENSFDPIKVFGEQTRRGTTSYYGNLSEGPHHYIDFFIKEELQGVEPYDIGTVGLLPGAEGKWSNYRFGYRPRGWLTSKGYPLPCDDTDAQQLGTPESLPKQPASERLSRLRRRRVIEYHQESEELETPSPQSLIKQEPTAETPLVHGIKRNRSPSLEMISSNPARSKRPSVHPDHLELETGYDDESTVRTRRIHELKRKRARVEREIKMQELLVERAQLDDELQELES